jgi:hypothetical protein
MGSLNGGLLLTHVLPVSRLFFFLISVFIFPSIINILHERLAIVPLIVLDIGVVSLMDHLQGNSLVLMDSDDSTLNVNGVIRLTYLYDKLDAVRLLT